MRISLLLDRLQLWQKFVILSLIALILAGIPTCLYLFKADSILDAAIREEQGIGPMASTLKAVQLTQQHSALSALILGGLESAKDARDARQREADQAYEAVSVIVKNLHNKTIEDAWNSARQDWEALRTRVANRSITIPESYAAHTALIPKLLMVNDLVGDSYELSLDPDLDTYQLIQAIYYQLPSLAEELGKMRAKGAGLLVKKEAAAEDKLAMASIVVRVYDRLLQVLTPFNKAAAANPAIARALTPGMQEIVSLASSSMQLATDRIVKAESLDYPAADYVAATTRAIDAQFSTNESASKELRAILDGKISGLRQTKWMVAGSMLALIVLAGLIQYFIAHSINVPLARAVAVAQRVAKGDLTSRFDVTGSNEAAQLLRALQEMNINLVKIVGNVRVGIDNIAAASDSIASGNADLSARTESQASSLEETASSMEELTSTVNQNADNARQANLLVVSASDVAVKGGQVVSQVVQTMGEINESSRKIVDIIGVIDGIAFQTNILALNAAVEAARAGEQGRGFAVVATEVRNLAQRSAGAAREIKALIGTSVEKVEVGNKLVDQAGKSMEEIVSSVKRVTDIMADIVMASQEQTSGIAQVSQAITRMDEMTQQNSALVEEGAAASDSMNEQTRLLMQSMSAFHLGDIAVATPANGASRPVPRANVRSHATGKKPQSPVRPVVKPAKPPAVAGGNKDEWEEF